MLYHVSKTAGLKVLKPHTSTHKQAYVYAVENKTVGFAFGAKQDDFDFIIDMDEQGILIVYECYPDAFNKIYQGKSCSVYCISEEGFQRGMTSWSAELVNPNEVPVLEEIRIEDIAAVLLEEEKRGTMKLFRYQKNAEYRKIIAEHIVDRIIRFELDLKSCMQNDSRFEIYYQALAVELLKITDGHLLL